MRAIVFLGCTSFGSSKEALRVAHGMGYDTILLTDRQSQIKQRDTWSHVSQMIYTESYELPALRKQIEKIRAKQREIAAIVSFVDALVHPAAVLMDEYCTPRISTEAVSKMECKIKTREALEGTPYGPWFRVCGNRGRAVLKREDLAHLPMIVKSPRSTGSKDVLKAGSRRELVQHIKALHRKYPHHHILLEEYLDGPQYLVECVVFQKKVQLITVIRQYIQAEHRFIITGYAVLQDLDPDFLASIQKFSEAVISRLGMVNGNCHLEIRRIHGTWKLIEINPRISGAGMNRMIEVASGINLVQELLKLHLGEPADLEKKRSLHVFARYLTVKKSGRLKKVVGRHEAWRIKGVDEVFVKPVPGDMLMTPHSMAHRYAYVIASSSQSLDEARIIAERAARQIRFVIA